MAVFQYKAVDRGGREMTGTLEADTADHARQVLMGMTLDVHSIEKAVRLMPTMRIGRHEFVLFNQQLASVAKAGVPLEGALRELCEISAAGECAGLVERIADELEAGTSIEEAFAKRKGRFPPLYGQILAAGVQSGRLAEMLTSLNRHLAVTHRTRKILFEAMCYPAVVLALAAIILTGLLAYVAPNIGRIFLDFDTELPAMTKALLALSDFVVWIWIGIGAGIAAVVVAAILLRRFAWCRCFFERVAIGLPLIGRIRHRGTLSRLADAAALLVGAGIDLPTCLRVAGGVSGSLSAGAECDRIADRIEQGVPVAEADEGCWMIPRLFVYSMQVGAQRNELADALYGLSDMYADQALTEQTRLQVGLLPIMLLVVGAFVGTAVVALFLPLLSLIQSLGM